MHDERINAGSWQRIDWLTASRGQKCLRDGTHRTAPLAATIARARALMPHMGITRIADVTGLDRIGIPVVMVCRPNSRSVAVAQGKGLDLAAATASGLMESAETWHAERIALPLRLASETELAHARRLANIARLPQIADSRFHSHLPILWIEGVDLVSGAPAWLPYEMVHTNYTVPQASGSGCFAASSNGLASGNQPLEAVCHGICEVIERDATSLWQRLPNSGRRRTRLDPASVDDAACRRILTTLAEAGLQVAVWHTTSDVGVPTFHCMIVDSTTWHAHPGIGAGCHASRAVALARAMLEAVQVRTTYIAGSRDDIVAEEYTRAAMAEKLDNALALLADDRPGCTWQDVPTFEHATLADDLDYLLQRLTAVGIDEVLAVNLTDPTLGLPVVRIVIPGLEAPHDDPGYVPGPRAAAVT